MSALWCSRFGWNAGGLPLYAIFDVSWLYNFYGLIKSSLSERPGDSQRKLDPVSEITACESREEVTVDPRVLCVICDEEVGLVEAVSCSSLRDPHWFCPSCHEHTVQAMVDGGVALSFDPSTTLPTCCYCNVTSCVLPTQHLPLHLQQAWDRIIVSKQMRDIQLLTCTHCGCMVVDDPTGQQSVLPEVGSSYARKGLRRRVASRFSGSSQIPAQFRCPECEWITCLAPRGCSVCVHPSDFPSHKCKQDDLRLEIEKAVDRRLVYLCRCGKSLVKEAGCNHCTCVCGAEYCHLCHTDLGRDQHKWKRHFCGHFVDSGTGKCRQCSKCPLYSSRDDDRIRRAVVEEVKRKFKRRQKWASIKRRFGW